MIRVISSQGKVKKIFPQLHNIEKLSRHAMTAVWFELGRDLKTSAEKEILRKPKGGRTYLVRGRGGRLRRHVASAPGETHAEITGSLRGSLDYVVPGWQTMDFGYLDDPPGHGGFLEFGTTKMAARPSLLNAINNQSAQVEKHFRSAMKREFG